MPAGQRGTFLRLELSDLGTEPFEVLGIKVDLDPLSVRPLPLGEFTARTGFTAIVGFFE